MRHYIEHESFLCRSERLYDELSVMAEEKEASTSAGAFSSLEDLLAVHLGTQTFLDQLKVVFEVIVERFHEKLVLMELHFDVLFEDCRRLTC